METYFSKFPIIEYNGINTRDLSRRVVLGNNLTSIPTVFYPYDIENEARSDLVAFNYYNDQDLDWLIYLVNGIVDPYYGWYLNDDEFNAFITEKYGGLDVAQQTISYWVTNWTEEDVNVTLSYWNALPEIARKYYVPVWGPKNRIVAYKRRPEDWIQNINQIVNVNVTDTSNFAVGNLVQSLNNVLAIVGSGQVMGVDTTNGFVQVGNTLGFWDATATSMQVRNDEASRIAISSVQVALTNISDYEAVYWTPIYAYDAERELNEQRKTILLLDPGYVRDAARGLSDLLKE